MGKKCCKSKPLCKDCPKRKKKKAKAATAGGKPDFHDYRINGWPQG